MIEHLTVRYILDRPDIDRNEFLYEITTLALNYLRIHDDPMRRAQVWRFSHSTQSRGTPPVPDATDTVLQEFCGVEMKRE